METTRENIDQQWNVELKEGLRFMEINRLVGIRVLRFYS